MYPKVKVRQEADQEGDDDFDLGGNLGLKALVSLSLQASRSPVVQKKDVSKQPLVEVPKCYLSPTPTPTVQITEDDFANCSVTSDSSGSTGPEKEDGTDERKINIRASPIPRPRAVVSSPYNDTMIGSRNRNRDGTSSASKNGAAVQQNRHSHCKVRSHDIDVTDSFQDTRNSKEPGSKDKTDPVMKIKVKKGCIKSENVHRVWRF